MSQAFARQAPPGPAIDPEAFQDAIETAPEAVFWTNAEGRFVYVNARACASLGYTRSELLALHIWEIDANLDREKWAEFWKQQVGGRTIEARHRCKDGTIVPVEISSKDLQTRDGRLRVAFVRDTTARDAVMAALRRTQFLVDRAREAIFWVKADGSFAYVNDAACKSLEYTRDELLRMAVFDIDPNVTREMWPGVWQRCREQESSVMERTHVSRSGRRIPVQVATTFMRFEGQEYNCAYARDVSEARRAAEERARLEAQLLHAQKLESIGRLAGGVAHDFNNLLSVISGYAELAARRLKPDEPARAQVKEIERAAGRARDVTRQLLAFSRKEMISPRPVDLNALVEGSRNALSRLIGEDLELRFLPGAGVPHILFDPSQMEQILMNLVVNARDAVSSVSRSSGGQSSAGGEIVIETTSARLDEAYCREHVDAVPGPYVVLTVTDSGCGMDSETMAHIFEPFFTTKETGKGTGLGLAMVYGIVRQHGGSIRVESKPGSWTTFRLYLPALKGANVEAKTGSEPPLSLVQGTILVVEDDPMVRDMTQSMLQTLGYTVLVVPGPEEAIELCERRDVTIDLLISDVVMPKIKGPELRDRIRTLRPDLDVLFISGYASDVLFHGANGSAEHFLQKPFSIAALGQAAREAMHR